MTTKPHGIQPSQMDLSVDPGVDFHRYCNGTWLANTEIPDAYPRWGNFMQLRDDALFYLHDLFQKLAATQSAPGSNAQKIGDLYASGMNEEQIEAEGLTALAADFARIDRVSNFRQLADVVARLHLIDASAFFGFGGGVDLNDSDSIIANAGQGGTCLERDYYLKTDKDTIEKRDAYLAHVQAMLELLGERPATARRHARAILDLETKLATASLSMEARRDPNSRNNKMSVAQFQDLCPSFPLERYFQKLGTPEFDIVNVGQPAFFQALETTLTTTPFWVLRAYLRYQLITATASYLPKRFGEQTFAFFGQVMQGTKVQTERWKRVTSLVSAALGEAVGEIYVSEKFPPEAKSRMQELISAMEEALAEMFTEMDWMDEQTQQESIEKLKAFNAYIGYPDEWQDYSALTIDRSSYVGNLLRVAEFESKLNLDKIGGSVDRAEWGMTPQTVNAQCSQTKNAIFFPAGIFQHPFFDMLADFAFILGAIGAVIGHEAWHNFDDKGSKFDKHGNIAKGWPEAVRANFEALMQLIKDLFSSFVVIEAQDGKEAVHMQGGLVCGEAISDLMGLRIVFRALQKMIAKYGRTVDANGFDDEQRFFIAFGQLWASKARSTYEAWQANNDPHPIERFRVNGTLGNMPEFFEAFDLAPDCPMALPEELRCDLLAGPRR